MRRKLALLSGSMLVCVVLAELLLRVTGLAEPVSRAYVGERSNGELKNFAVDPVLGWRMPPHHEFVWKMEGRPISYRADAEGWRVGESDASDQGPVLLAAGDSFTFGLGVTYEETFADRIARRLGDWRLRNVAMPGFGLDQVWLSLRESLRDVRPELVLVGIFERDFHRSQTAYREYEQINKPLFRLVGGELKLQTADDRPAAWFRWLERSSRLLAGFRVMDRRIGRRAGRGEWWSLNQAFLEEIRRECESAEVPVLFVYLPERRWQPFPALSDWMVRVDADFVDLTVARPQPPADAYFQDDPHLTAAGHRFVAEIVLEWIQEHRPELVPLASEPGTD